MNFAFADIGELGWSISLSAHVRWLKNNTNFSVAVIALTDRKCLYGGLADIILDVPEIFYNKFDSRKQNCFGLKQTLPEKLRNFFLSYIPADYCIPDYFIFRCKLNLGNKVIYRPYKYSKPIEGNAEILIFPRCRNDELNRNIPKSFYAHLIERLCDEFPELTIRTIGTDDGAYNIDISKPNYINWVGLGDSLQDLIDRCQVARAAVGGQSSPPKITLLQGVPTFMIGHQERRHISVENWMNTKAGFYGVAKDSYNKFDSMDCVAKIISFVRGCGGKL
jgi:hypothetical protein